MFLDVLKMRERLRSNVTGDLIQAFESGVPVRQHGMSGLWRLPPVLATDPGDPAPCYRSSAGPRLCHVNFAEGCHLYIAVTRYAARRLKGREDRSAERHNGREAG